MRSPLVALLALAPPALAQDMLAVDWLGGIHAVDSVTGVRGQIGATGVAGLHNCLTVGANGIVYTIVDGQLVSIDPLTGTGATVLQVSGGPNPQTPRGLAYRSSDNTLFAVFDGGWQGIDELWRIDPVSGLASFVGPTRFSGIQALTLGSNGVLYAANLGLGGLVTVDQNSGLATDLPGPGAIDVQFLTETGDGRLIGGRQTLYEFDRLSGDFSAYANIPNEWVDLRGCDWIGPACEIGAAVTRYCNPANANSSGDAAFLLASGCANVGDNRLSISAQLLPASQFGYFLASTTQGFVPFAAGSQGNLCLAGQVARYTAPILNSDFGRAIGLFVDLTSIPVGAGPVAVQPGDTWNFQAWFRDVNPTPTSNFTDAVSITFQ